VWPLTFEFSDIRVRWNLDRDLPNYTLASKVRCLLIVSNLIDDQLDLPFGIAD